jgi:replicative DNA helicase
LRAVCFWGSRDLSAQLRIQPQPKQPPHSIEAEQSVLGGLMLDNRRWDDLADRLSAEDFYRQDHQLIYSAISAL